MTSTDASLDQPSLTRDEVYSQPEIWSRVIAESAADRSVLPAAGHAGAVRRLRHVLLHR